MSTKKKSGTLIYNKLLYCELNFIHVHDNDEKKLFDFFIKGANTVQKANSKI